MKKSIVILAGLVGIFIVAWATLREPSSSLSRLSDSLTPSLQKTKISTFVPMKGSLIKDLHRDVLLLGAFQPTELQPLIKYATDWHKKFRATKIWTKLEIDKEIERSLKKEKPGTNIPEIFKTPASTIEFFSNLYSATKEVLVVFSKSTFQIEGFSIPNFFAAASFKNDDYSTKLLDLLTESLFSESKVISKNDYSARFERTESSSGKIFLTLKVEKFELESLINVSADEVSFMVGDLKRSAFFTSDKDKQFLNSSSFKEVAPGLISGAFLEYFIDLKALQTLVNSSSKTAIARFGSDKATKEILESFSIYSDFLELFSVSQKFDPGFRTDMCIKLTPSALDKFHEFGGLESYNYPDVELTRLISEKSFFAMRMPIGYILWNLDSITSQYQDLLKKADGTKESKNDINEVFKNMLSGFQESINKAQLSHVMALVNSPKYGMLPEAAVIVTSKQDNIPEVLKSLEQTLVSIAKKIDTHSKNSLQIEMDGDGENSKLTITIGNVKIIGTQIAPKTLALSSSSVFSRTLKIQLSKEPLFMKSLSIDGEDLNSIEKKFDTTQFLNTKAILGYLQPLVGTAMLGLNGQQGITTADMEELLELFKGVIFVGSEASLSKSGVSCASAHYRMAEASEL